MTNMVQELTLNNFATAPIKGIYPTFDDNTNYKINQIILTKEQLTKEEKDRNKYKKRYTKISKSLEGMEWLSIISEIGLTATTVVFSTLIPIAVPVCLGLTIATASIRTGLKMVASKIEKHASIELLAKSKLNSIHDKYMKALEDGSISIEEFEDIMKESRNYDTMKYENLQKHKGTANTGGPYITQDIQNMLKDKGKEEFKKELKAKLNI